MILHDSVGCWAHTLGLSYFVTCDPGRTVRGGLLRHRALTYETCKRMSAVCVSFLWRHGLQSVLSGGCSGPSVQTLELSSNQPRIDLPEKFS